MVADVSALYLIRVGDRSFVRRGTPAYAVAGALHGVKAAPDPRDAAERKLMEELEALFRTLAPDVAAMIAKGQMPSDKELADAFGAVLRPALAEIAIEEFGRVGGDVGVLFDPAVVNARMVAWSQTYTYELVKGISETTRTQLQTALATFASTPGMTIKELEALIEPSFGKQRAQVIAITELTRASSQATNVFVDEMAAVGMKRERVWRTMGEGPQRISHVCDICQPLNGKAESVWKEQFPDGPPGHIGCRCRLTSRSVD